MNLILSLFNLALLFISGMFIHEGGHLIGALLQGVRSRIEVWKFGLLPSLETLPYNPIKNDALFYYSGGLFVGFIYLFLYLVSYKTYIPELQYPLLAIGVSQILYGIFEGTFIKKIDRKPYMIIHYLIYVITWIICLIPFID